MVKVKLMLVPDNVASKVISKSRSKITSVTVHETDNTNKGANANAHARLQYNGNNRTASWHYQVDDKEVIQSFPDIAKCWAGGDGVSGPSQDSIHIEICVNSDGDFSKAKSNAQALVRLLMKKYNIPISKVYQHNKWSGKNCPRNLRKGGWREFIDGISKKEDGLTVSQYNNLLKLIKDQQKEIDLLKSGNTSQEPSSDLSKEWEFGTEHKLTDGRNPHQHATRQHVMAFISRYDRQALTLSQTAKDDLQELFNQLYDNGTFKVRHKVEGKSNTDVLGLLVSAVKRSLEE